MANNTFGERLVKVETIIEDHKEEINKLKNDNMLLHRLTANQEVLTEVVKENQSQMRDFNKTLININSNITHLNNSSDEIRRDLIDTQKELKDIRENKKSEFLRGKFDVIEFISKDAIKLIGIAILTAILAYIGLN